MFKFKKGWMITLLLIFSMQSFAVDTVADRDQRMEWWHDAHFGMFVHWGLYSIAAGKWGDYEQHGGGAEWLQKRASILPDEYETILIPQFNPKADFAAEWASMAKRAGCKYVVFTSKHHEGFALHDSAETTFDAKDACGRDLVQEITDATRAEGLKVGLYHSLIDWHHPDAYVGVGLPDVAGTSNAGRTNSVYVDYLHAQVEELVSNYGMIDLIWWDYSSSGCQGEAWRSTDLVNMIRSYNPNVILNNRLYKMSGGWPPNWENEILIDTKYGDYCTPEQHSDNTGKEVLSWESCMTMNSNWGYNQFDNNWKSSESLIRTLVDIVSRGGNFLLNIGPMADGSIPPESVSRLNAMGDWMDLYGESIYGTRASIIEEPSWGFSTTKTLTNGSIRVYLHIKNWPSNGELLVPSLVIFPQTAELITPTGAVAISCAKKDGDFFIKVPGSAVDSAISVVELTFDVDPTDASNLPGLENLGLRADWKLDDAAGSTALDSSGYAAHGTLTTTPSWGVGHDGGGALSFNGVDDMVTFGTAPSLNGQTDFAVTAWVKTTSTSTGVIIQQRANGEYDGEYQLFLNANGTVHFMVYGNRGYQYQMNTTQTVNDGAWHYIVATRDGLDGAIYIDGNPTPAATETGTAIRDLDSYIAVVMGQDDLTHSKVFNGLIDDVKIYDIALNASLVAALYAPQSPTISDATFSVLENAAVGTAVGTVVTTDPNAGDKHAYIITDGNAENLFAMDPATGVISVAGGIDYEATASFNLGIKIYDLSGLTDTATVSISVLDVVNDDSDADGMIDEWEVIHFGSSLAQDGFGDPDNDHVINKWEHQFNTDPNNSSEFTASYVGFRAWWKLDDASGSIAADSSGYEANGALTGPSWSTNGYNAGALSFDGIDDLVNFGTAASLSGQTDLTLTAWVKTTNTATGVILQQRGDGGYNGEYQLLLKADGTVYFMLYGNGEYQYRITTSQAVNDGAWHLIVAVRDGLNGYIYIDGNPTPAASATGPAIRDLDSTIGVVLGKDQLSGNSFFNGLIDDVRIYDIALDAAAIANLYNPTTLSRVYLSDLNWVSQTTGWGGTVKKDLSIQNNPIVLDGITYPKGLGAHAQSEIVYNLAGNYVIFHSIVGVDDETGSNGSVIFKVYGDNVLLYETAAINATGTETLNIAVAGVQTLKLVADGNGSIAHDHADWADACVLSDNDSDGLVDEWEITHFGDITAQDGAGDPDNDGASNRQEQTFNTDPMDANDAPSAEYLNLCGWWKLNDLSGVTALDSSGNGNDGSLSGGSWVSGIEAGALDFVAANQDSVEIPAAAFASIDTEITFSVWVYGDAAVQPQQNAVLRASDASGSRVLTTHLPWSSSVYWDAGNSGSSYDRINKSATLSEFAGQWNHWVFTKNVTTGDMTIYLNGQLWHSGTGKTHSMSGVVTAHIGSVGGIWNFYDGTLDEIRLYNRVLTATEIDALYQQNVGVYNVWKGTQFTAAELANPAISGDAADVDADQLSNLIEYALGLDPKVHSGSLAGCAIELDGANGWKVEFNRHASRNDINLVLEWSDELNPANWQPVAQSIAGGAVQPLNGASLVSETGSEPTVVELNVPSTIPHGFIRWKVTRR